MDKVALALIVEREAFEAEFKKIAEELSDSGPEVKVDDASKKPGFFGNIFNGGVNKARNAYDSIKGLKGLYENFKGTEGSSTMGSIGNAIKKTWTDSPDLRHLSYGAGALALGAGIGGLMARRKRRQQGVRYD